MSKKADTCLSEPWQALQKFTVVRLEMLLFDFSRPEGASRRIVSCALELNLSDTSTTDLSK